MDSNSFTNTFRTNLTDQQINQLTKKDKYNYYLSQVNPNLIEEWKKYKRIFKITQIFNPIPFRIY